ncbi:hypothetical protein TNCV_1663771 [Trichonephila clavipes]|nr:hypothetical protein TNCV_1663771 [Trichonephila clavipes]
MAQYRGAGVRDITTPLPSCLIPRYTHMRRNLLKTYLFPLTKSSQFGSRPVLSITFRPILQILDGDSAVCQDPDNVLNIVESMIKIIRNSDYCSVFRSELSITNSNEFRSKES